jgi:hypothetical protein
MVNGFQIVCPDGLVRCCPYTNEGDAECDAKVYTRRVKCAGEQQETPCPGGEHKYEPARFERPGLA